MAHSGPPAILSDAAVRTVKPDFRGTRKAEDGRAQVSSAKILELLFRKLTKN